MSGYYGCRFRIGHIQISASSLERETGRQHHTVLVIRGPGWYVAEDFELGGQKLVGLKKQSTFEHLLRLKQLSPSLHLPWPMIFLNESEVSAGLVWK